MRHLAAATILIVLSCASCTPTQRVTARKVDQLHLLRDSAQLVQARSFDFRLFDSCWIVTDTVTTLIVRHAVAAVSAIDSVRTVSTELQTEYVRDTLTLTPHAPLMVQSKKKGLAWLCPLVVFGFVLILIISCALWLYFKKIF